MGDVYEIEGGPQLHGEVRCSGAKNSVLKLLTASILASGTHELRRVPRIIEVDWISDILNHLGGRVSWTGEGVLSVEVPETVGEEVPYELGSRMRTSVAMLGPMLARRGRARVALPGGCNLGPRGIDVHVRGLEQLGADIHVSHGFLEGSAQRLRGTTVDLEWPSHTATENLMMAAVLAEGRTTINNAAREPEITDLATFLQGMGAKITGAGTARIEIEGVHELHPSSLDVMPDRLEAGTFLFAAAATGGDVVVANMVPKHLEIVLEKLRQAGMELEVGEDRVRIRSDGLPQPVDISTLPFPGFPTDLQPLAVALLCRAPRLSIVTENIFDSRFIFVDELARMGADIRVDGQYAVIRGVKELTGAPVRASDLRAGAALVVAGLVAEGKTVLEDIHHVDRGYERLEEKLQTLGAGIRRVPADELARA